MYSRIKNLSRKKKVIVLTILLLVMLSASRYFFGPSHFSRITALENRLEEKGASIIRSYTGPALIKPYVNSLIKTRFKSIARPFYKTWGFAILDAKIEDDLWVQISKSNYSQIMLDKTNISESNLTKILNMPNLHILGLKNSDTSDKYFNLIKNRSYPLPSIVHLDLRGTKISDKSTKNLPEVFIKSLYFLNLSDTLITDQTLENLSDCRNLQFLKLSGNKITDKGVAYLKTESNIDYLWLNNTLITDKSVPHLMKMKSLKHLAIEGTKISPEGYQELKSKMPWCDIEYKTNAK